MSTAPSIERLEPRTLLALSFDAVVTLGGNGLGPEIDVAPDGRGGFAVAGPMYGRIDFDPGPGQVIRGLSGSASSYVARYDKAGGLLWVIATPSNLTPTDLEVGSAGDVYMSARITGTIDANPSKARLMFTSAGDEDLLVVRYTSAGRLRWAAQLGGAGKDLASGVALAPNGDVVVAGGFEGRLDADPGPGQTWLTSAGHTDALVVRLTADAGALAYAGRVGGPWADTINAVASDPTDGAVYVTGSYFAGADLNPGKGRVIVDAPKTGAFVTALRADMAFRWARAYAPDEHEHRAWRLAVAHGGNVYAAGISTTCLASDWLWCLDRAGKTLFARPEWAPDDAAHDRVSEFGLAAGPGGRLYSAGKFIGTVDFDPGPGRVLRTARAADAYVLELDAMGRYVDVSVIGGRGGQWGDSLAVGPGGKVFAAGHFSGPTDFDPGRDVVFRTTPEDKTAVWVLRLNP
jgi:hypothetical protein